MTIYCEGEEAEAVPVVLATISRSGHIRPEERTPKPLYHVCSACGEVVPDRLAVR